MGTYTVLKDGYYQSGQYPIFYTAGSIITIPDDKATYDINSGHIAQLNTGTSYSLLLNGNVFVGNGVPTVNAVGFALDRLTGKSYLNTGTGWVLYSYPTTSTTSTTPSTTTSSPGGGVNNTTNYSDPNNAYRIAMAA